MYIFFFFICMFLSLVSSAQLSNKDIVSLIEKYKKEVRGLGKNIRCFCPDGRTNLPKEFRTVDEAIPAIIMS